MVYLDHVQGFLHRKRLVHDWFFMKENTWVRQLLPGDLYPLLEFDTKISQGIVGPLFPCIYPSDQPQGCVLSIP